MCKARFNSKARRDPRMPAGFTLIELMIVVSVVIIMSAVAIPSFQNVISSRRLQAVAWQMVQDLRTAREDAILYQQDLNVYINYNNTPVVPTDPTNKNNRSYLFETFQYGYDQTPQVDGQHYIPIPTDLSGSHSHFTQRVLQYGIVISLIASTKSSSISSGANYCVVCFRSGAGSAFRGEGDLVTVMNGTNNRVNSASGTDTGMIDKNNLVITLKDPSTLRTFNVIVKGTGEVSMGNS